MFWNNNKDNQKSELKTLELFDGRAGTTFIFHSDIKILFPDKPVREYDALLLQDNMNARIMQDLKEDGYVDIEFKLAHNNEKSSQRQIPIYTLTTKGEEYRQYLHDIVSQMNKPSLPEP